MRRFSICVLLYGDDQHAWLHTRCLESIVSSLPLDDMELRIGLNAVTSQATWNRVNELAAHLGPERVRLFAGENIGKYPRMREMFATITRPYVAWWDDDSYLLPELRIPGAGQAWLNRIAELLRSKPGVLGAVYRRRWRAQHKAWLQQQPGYRGVPLDPLYEKFVTGGWWVAPVAMLRELAWPPLELHHNGGDRLLGSLALQHQYSLIPFRHGVAINADADGRESQAPRRGLNTKPLGD
jgi:hypothetical protein